MKFNIYVIIINLMLLGCTTKKIDNNKILNIKNSMKLDKVFPYNERSYSQYYLYVDFLKELAISKGISQSTIDRSFTNVKYIESTVKSDKGQYEKKKSGTLTDYLKKVLSESRIRFAIKKYLENKYIIDSISKMYGVPQQYILSLWGLESDFGRYQGEEDVISALITLSFEGRRESFFVKQLFSALEIIDKEYVSKDFKLNGSWAGAMGQVQFMPTSYLFYAVDGDGDGKIDIWNNKSDIFSSIANYLAIKGWDSQFSWGCQVSVSPSFNLKSEDLKKGKTVNEWKQLGVKIPLFIKLPSNLKTWIVIVNDLEKKIYLVTKNFYSIMNWNNSYYFALSVCIMSDIILNNL
ncbi:Membrane-bound lytic murein transglycosylase B [Candidatus Providencia siddallii]|uniref:Membrane-bound lytic murein transglycosylase B n=1 Tax=Candidatus Providencia siddallii TaxID=1715285 RepID=A0A0M6W8D5_9GAMM|nr:Membrane-bound lytic murein transglycosylase B [Candidatus Providencia siddallii]